MNVTDRGHIMNALKKILLVDDEPDIGTLGTMALESLGGYQVKTCISGQEALATVASFNPDLILLDVMMPELDGPSTLSRLRDLPAGADIPVVFFTAKTQENDLAQLRQTSALDILSKPFDPMQLADDVQSIWERHHGEA